MGKEKERNRQQIRYGLSVLDGVPYRCDFSVSSIISLLTAEPLRSFFIQFFKKVFTFVLIWCTLYMSEMTKEIYMKIRVYYGWNYDEQRVMTACVTGEMCDGTLVYVECDANGEPVPNPEGAWYTRTLKYGTQMFIRQ